MVDKICDMLAAKQVLKGYKEGSFAGKTGLSIQCLDKRKCAKTTFTRLTNIESNTANLVDLRQEAKTLRYFPLSSSGRRYIENKSKGL